MEKAPLTQCPSTCSNSVNNLDELMEKRRSILKGLWQARSETWCKWFCLPSPIASCFLARRMEVNRPLKYLLLGITLLTLSAIGHSISLIYQGKLAEVIETSTALPTTDDVNIVPIEQEEWYLAIMSLSIGLIACIFTFIWLIMMCCLRRRFDKLRGFNNCCHSCLLTFFCHQCSIAQMGTHLELENDSSVEKLLHV
ncbi:Oidioi.mRNA.OKI2018_I69.XSR.g16101.t1.cds [Oikopleura dioica]|uniref:Oidioi.mRNA.OKI2018_I69.XSR.g16101.t1.cds n=1 Tax=Oikopleura dioica TaxID=34765 RepID=A0ABN7SIX8_OIKDI|nr:Oidioi.mRNA.OKI2018_I69.XSR.g16101.t1.cds [Oikopleura dioica]